MNVQSREGKTSRVTGQKEQESPVSAEFDLDDELCTHTHLLLLVSVCLMNIIVFVWGIEVTRVNTNTNYLTVRAE